MKKTFLTFIITLLYIHAFAQNAKVIDSPSGAVISNAGGTDIPYSASILDIRSSNKGVLLPRMSTGSRDAIGSPQAGLLLFNSTTNQFNYHDGAAWQQAFFGNQWSVNGAKYYYNGGNVGIGISNPLAPLVIYGTTSANMLFQTAASGTGSSNGIYVGLASGDGYLWNYDNSALRLGTNSATRMTIAANGNIGIGTSLPDFPLEIIGSTRISNNLAINDPFPDYNLDVNGNASIEQLAVGSGTAPQSGKALTVTGDVELNSDLHIDGNTILDGGLTVNNNKGVAYNASGSTNLKIFPFTTATFHAVLGGHDLSAEGAIVFGGGFTQAPKVIVGDIDVTGGTVGELYRVQLVLYGCSTNLNGSGNTGCKARLLNTSPNSVNYTITWNCVAIGY